MDTFETPSFPGDPGSDTGTQSAPEAPRKTQAPSEAEPASQIPAPSAPDDQSQASGESAPEPQASGEPAPEPQAPEEAVSGSYYSGAGTGRKESPYANSPYETSGHRFQEETFYQPQTREQYQAQHSAPAREESPRKQRKRPRRIWKAIGAAAASVALVACGCLITAAAINEYWEDRTEDTVSALTDRIEDLEEQLDDVTAPGGAAALPEGTALTPRQLYTAAVDSVVAITGTVETSSFYGSSSGSTSGSGFILTEDGYVITNYHVVENADDVKVILHDATEYPAQIIGSDSTNDLAVLKIDASGLSAAKLGSSEALNIGDMVVAIGSPLGELTATQTVGYVSGIKREVTTSNSVLSMIQTDASINPGNSGGPLFNMYGEVVGITTAKYSGTTDSGASIEGIGFAIPIDDVMDSISDLVDHGYVSTAYLGITVTDTDEDSAAMFNLPTGAYVVEVVEGYAADQAGIQPKDIIIALGDTTVSNQFELIRALRDFTPGEQTTITILRSGKEITLDIVLDEKPQETTGESAETLPAEEPPSEDMYDYFRRYFG